MARISKLRRHVAFMPQRQYFEDLFNENGGVLSYDKKPSFATELYKTVLSWKSSEGACEKREEGERRSGSSVTLNLLLTSGFPGQHFQNYAKKLVHTLKRKISLLKIPSQ